jgi:hypothetical protein
MRSERSAGAPRAWSIAATVGLWAAFYWAMYYPQPYSLAVGLQAVIPLFVIGLLVRGGRLGGFGDRAAGSSSAVGLAFVLSIIAVAYRALRDFSLLDWGRFWIPFAVAGVAMTAVLHVFAADVRKKFVRTLVVAPFCFAYAYGLLVHVNCHYDNAWPVTYPSRILRHDHSSGRGVTLYHLTLNPWLGQPRDRRVEVPREFYSSHADGSPVHVAVHPGRLGFPWFSVE